MPTLYCAADGNRKPKVSITELMLYNMASMLAGVATGYDVRMSNVSPVHPKLQPQQLINDEYDHLTTTCPIDSSEFIVPDKDYAHNTYHGPSKHYRFLYMPIRIICYSFHFNNLIFVRFHMAHTDRIYLQCNNHKMMIDRFDLLIHRNIIYHQQCRQQVV